MQPQRIEERAPIRLVGLETTFISGMAENTNAGERIGPLWGQFLGRLDDIPRSNTILYGYSWHLPEAQRTHEHELGYLAGAPVAPDAAVPDGMAVLETPAALYAIFEHHGPITTFSQTLLGIYRDWLPASDYVGNGLGDLEVYDERYKDGGDDSVVEYWCGIQPKA